MRRASDTGREERGDNIGIVVLGWLTGEAMGEVGLESTGVSIGVDTGSVVGADTGPATVGGATGATPIGATGGPKHWASVEAELVQVGVATKLVERLFGLQSTALKKVRVIDPSESQDSVNAADFDALLS